MFGRASRTGPQVRNANSSCDPEAPPEFTPAVRMSSKRKASSSSAKSGKTLQLGPRAATGVPIPTDPIINSNDLFGASGRDRRVFTLGNMNVMLDSSSEDENDIVQNTMLDFDLPLPARRLRDPVASTPETLVRMGDSENDPPKLAAILINRDHTSQSTFSLTGHDVCHAQYLPLCPAGTSVGLSENTNNMLYTVLANHRDRIQQSEHAPAQTKATWPLDELPVELFDLITAHLSRDSVKSMRLVNREFERKVSRSLFHTSVVPFNTELYDMIEEDQKTLTRIYQPKNKGKGKLKVVSPDQVPPSTEKDIGGLQWQNAREDTEGKVYKGHGLRVFQGFGPHIKRFGMSFEVSEKQLAKPPIKKALDHVHSYHGSYDWPSSHYARFANLAGLENTADETSRMKAAFANLEIVQELALSIDSGLGWLNGPDKSVRGRIFERPSAVFGSAYDVPDNAALDATMFWNALQQSQLSVAPDSNHKEIVLQHRALPSTPAGLDGLRGNVYSETQRWPSIDAAKVLSMRSATNLSGFGVLYTTNRHNDVAEGDVLGLPLIPSQLKKEQKEWLLETQWAQQAFLETYVLAVIDNPINFEKITTLNVAKLSSRFLLMLARDVFWDALPCLSDVILHVCPDWRTVEKDDAGLATTKFQTPSEAIRIFHKEILRERISVKESIKKLDIGWYGGGEHAEGMHARNANILPAPVTQLDHSTISTSGFGLVFPYVEHLALCNCWITPPTLEGLVKSHSSRALKKVTLDSVSLTAHPRFQPINGQGGGIQQLAQAMVAMQAQLANNGPAPQPQHVLQQPPAGFAQQMAHLGPNFVHGMQGLNAQQLAMMQQHWNQHMQQMQQIFNGAPNAPNAAQVAPMQMVAAPNVGQLQPPPAANPGPSNGAAPSWTRGHREGCWPQLLDAISPGLVFDDYIPPPQPWEDPLPPRPETNLQTIKFKSCGYAKLPNHTGFEQFVLEPDAGHARSMSPWFRTRWQNLKPLMLETRDRYLGQIVQYIPQRELDSLQFAWGLTEGWNDRAKAEEAEFDGLLAGGTGRFSGVVARGMALVGQPATPPPRTA